MPMRSLLRRRTPRALRSAGWNAFSSRPPARVWLASAMPLLIVAEAAFGQIGASSRRWIQSRPPNAAPLGQTVTLSVQPTVAGASYRFVATMLSTGDGTSASRACARPRHTIGSGSTVTWTPASGTYRLTAYGPSPTLERDTLVSQYEVRAPDAMVSTEYIPPQPPPGGTPMASLILSAKDLGPGHRYRFSVRFGPPASPPPGQHPVATPAPWTFESEKWSIRFPLSVASTTPAFATAAVHRGDRCQIVAVGASP